VAALREVASLGFVHASAHTHQSLKSAPDAATLGVTRSQELLSRGRHLSRQSGARARAHGARGCDGSVLRAAAPGAAQCHQDCRVAANCPKSHRGLS